MLESTIITLTAQTPDGFKVARVGREYIEGNSSPYFTAGVSTYSNQRAWEIGAESRTWDHDLSAFPDAQPIARLSGADTTTGEPVHGPANGWYRLSGADMAHEIDMIERMPARPSYRDTPAHRSDYDHLSPDFAQFFVNMAARCLRCDVDELPNVQDPDLFAAWVADEMRPRWQEEADRVNALIDRLAAETPFAEEPSERSERVCTYTLGEGADRIMVDARESGEAYREAGTFFQYTVTVRDGARHRYTSTYGGSVADYEAGKHDARGACARVLAKLLDALDYSSGEEWADEMGMLEGDYRETRETVKMFDRVVSAAERMRSALEANAETIGG